MSVEQLQSNAQALQKSLNAGNPTAAEIQAVNQHVPNFATDQGTRDSLARLHTQVINHQTYLNGLESRNDVQNSTLSALNQLSSTLTSQGINERHVNTNLTGNDTANSWINSTLNLPYNLTRRLGGSATTAHYVSLGTGLALAYGALRAVGAFGGRAVRRTGSFLRSWFAPVATFAAGVGAVFGLQRFFPNALGNNASAAPLDQASEKQAKENLEKMNKAATPVGINSTQLNNINLMELTAPITLSNGQNVRLTRAGNLVQLQIGNPVTTRYNISGSNHATVNTVQIVTGSDGNRYLHVDATALIANQRILIPENELGTVAAAIAPGTDATVTRQVPELASTTAAAAAGDVTVRGIRYRRSATPRSITFNRP